VKKNLLISYGNAYIFHEVVFPSIEELSEKFNLYIVITNGFVNSQLITDLDSQKKLGHIQSYHFSNNDGLFNIKKYSFLSNILLNIKKWNIDLVLADSETCELNRLILDNFPSTTFCMLWTALGYNLLEQNIVDNSPHSDKQYWNFIQYKESTLRNLGLKPWLTKHYSNKSFMAFIVFLVQEVFRRLSFKFKKLILVKVHSFINSLIQRHYSVYFSKLGKVGTLTKLSDNLATHHFFVDDFEKDVMSSILTKGNCITINYPTLNHSLLNLNKNSKLLFILTTGYSNQEKLPHTELKKIENELKSIMKHSDTTEIDLKPHPRETKKWPFSLQNHLNSIGIKTNILPNQIPFRDILTDYKAVTGFASSSFRDIKYQNPNIQIYGMERLSITVAKTISKSTRLNVPLWFGNGEGINWLRVDGNIYNGPEIVTRDSSLLSELIKTTTT
jgi:hypothetical protein